MEDDPEALLAAQLADVAARETIAPDIAAPAEPRPPLEVLADPRLLELVEGRFRSDLVRERELPRWAGELPFHLDPVVWRTGFLEVTEGGPPLSIREGLLENVPQANLRDLFRPEWADAPVAMEHIELAHDRGGRHAFAELRRARTLEPLPRIERLALSLGAIDAERREVLRAPWKPFLSDDQPRRDAFVVIEPSLGR